MKNVRITIQVVLGIFYLNMVSACLFFFIPSFNGFSGSSWVWENDLIDASPSDQFLVSVYWSYVTLVSIGYGDITPVSIEERLYSIFWMIIGVGLYSYLIGFVITMIKEIDEDQEQF